MHLVFRPQTPLFMTFLDSLFHFSFEKKKTFLTITLLLFMALNPKEI